MEIKSVLCNNSSSNSNNNILNNDIQQLVDNDDNEDLLTNQPIELILYIISMCNPFDIINSISRVSRLLYRCSRNNSLWKMIALNHMIPDQMNRIPIPNYSNTGNSSSSSSSLFDQLSKQYQPDINWLNYFVENVSLNQNDSMMWSKRTPTTKTLQRYCHTSTTIISSEEKGKTKFMVIGGSDCDTAVAKSDIIIVDPLEPTFKMNQPIIKKEVSDHCFVEMAELDIGICRHTADYIPGVGVFVFGGLRTISKNSCVFLSLPRHTIKSNSMDLMIYQSNKDDGVDRIIWKPLKTTGTIPSSRSDHTSTVIGKDIYIFGGSDESIKPLNDLYVFHTDTMVWEKIECLSPPSPRSGHSMISVGKTIYIYGGGVWDRIKSWVNRNSQLFKLEIDDHVGHDSCCILEWKEIKCYKSPTMTTFSSFFAVGHHIFLLFGGCYNSFLTDSKYYLDTITNIWHPLKGINSPSNKNCAGLCTLGNKIYFIGGSNGSVHVDILEIVKLIGLAIDYFLSWISKSKSYSEIMIKGG
ncbi:hypothetical protein DFA_02257 [Cavenderia fasciculata]|uniref:F-box domain-containing protein n=1 Tax=Cavenderia fasciculata TaxID=261658 RepID=F4PYY5_CACFS|nr:uncharacterized protein DFA_02257 [Cavenderia fasciculata]EGG19014.1 hypothetical protein DFA_02257 [Cavenderia fasciculata]|eukprot:XP_004366647.1 hypothetical protein DFA_02257 [Cavenderia fasciculata]